MKYFFLLGLLLSIQVGFAQSEAKITLQKEKVTFKEIISSLEKQSGYLFSWDATCLPHILKSCSESLDNTGSCFGIGCCKSKFGYVFEKIEESIRFSIYSDYPKDKREK